MNTSPEFPDLPGLFARMRAADGVDEQRPTRRRFAEIRDRATRQTSEERQAVLDYVNKVQIGLDALTLGQAFLDQGDLGSAVRMFTIAVRHDADGATEELRAAQRLQTAFAESGLPDDTVLGAPEHERHPHDDAGARGISVYTLDWADQQAQQIMSDAQVNAADIVREAEERAQAIIADAKAAALQSRVEALPVADELHLESHGAVLLPDGTWSDDSPVPHNVPTVGLVPIDQPVQRWLLKTAAQHATVSHSLDHIDWSFSAAAAGLMIQQRPGLHEPPPQRRPARTQPRQAPTGYNGRLILPGTAADARYDAAGRETWPGGPVGEVALRRCCIDVVLVAGLRLDAEHGDLDEPDVVRFARTHPGPYGRILVVDSCVSRTWLICESGALTPHKTPEREDDPEDRAFSVITDRPAR